MYYNKDINEIEKELQTSNKGLTKEEAAIRQEKYGKNLLPKKESDSIVKIFFNEFKDPMVILLLVAIITSLIAGETIDAIAIFVIVLIDAIMGAYQENKANHTAEALAKLVKTKVKVVRGKKVMSIDAEDLTIGDYVLLESGDKISADMRIVEAHNLMIDESILTGESVQVNKNSDIINKDNVIIAEQSNMAFSGTTVVTGRAKAIVVDIGLKTEIGKIADSINNAEEEKSPLTIRVEKLSKQISMLVLAVAVIITVLLIMKNVPYHEIFLSVIALAVSAMPEGLPMPLVAIQLLWLNVVTDGIQDFALSFEKAEKGILKEKPRDPKESIFNKELLQEILVSGSIIGIVVFTVWYMLLNKFSMEVSVARGYIMALMVFIQNIHVFNCRSEHRSAFKVPIKNNWLIVGGVVASVLLQIIVMEVPGFSSFLQTVSIPAMHLIWLFAIALSVLIVMEIYKKINNSIRKID